MKNFPLFGKEVAVPIELANFNVFRKNFFTLADTTLAKLDAQYKKFSSIESLLNKFPDIYDEHLNVLIANAVENLICNKIYDVDASIFWKEHVKHTKAYGVFSNLEDQYESILEDQAEKNAYRKARRQNRGKWVGGGFGMEGAIKGAVNAGVLNAGGSIAHGTANVIGSAFSSMGAAIKKSALFNDKNTYSSIISASHFDFRLVLFTFVDFMKKNKLKIKAVTAKEQDSAAVMFKSISSPSFPKEDIPDAMVKIVLLNPYEEKYYFFLVDKFGDENKEVENLAAFFHIDVEKYKEDLVLKYYKELPILTLEDALAARDNTANFCKRLGGVPNAIQEEIDRLVEDKKYEKIYAKFSTYSKSSLSEWSLCRKEIESLCKDLAVSDNGAKILTEIDKSIFDFKVNLAQSFLATLPTAEEEDAIASKEKLIAYCVEIQLEEKNPVTNEIDEIIKKIDQNIRTVEGHEFGNRADALKANAEKKKIDMLFDKGYPISLRDYQTLSSYLNKNTVMSELDQIYRKRCSDMFAKIAKLSNRALSHEHRKKTRLKLFSGNKKSTIITSAIYFFAVILAFIPFGIIISAIAVGTYEIAKRNLEKKAWNELTHAGQYELAFILAPERV